MQITTKSGRKLLVPNDADEKAINKGIDQDDDTFEMDIKSFQKLKKMGRPKSNVHKIPVSIRLDVEIIDGFKSMGKGWQSKINEVLAHYIENNKKT